MGWEISGIMKWSGKFLVYAGVFHNADYFPYQVADKIRKFELWLWLLLWDGYGCCYGYCYGCCHGMAMVAAMVVAMVVAMVAAMVAAMGLLWLLLWDGYGCCHGKAEW